MNIKLIHLNFKQQVFSNKLASVAMCVIGVRMAFFFTALEFSNSPVRITFNAIAWISLIYFLTVPGNSKHLASVLFALIRIGLAIVLRLIVLFISILESGPSSLKMQFQGGIECRMRGFGMVPSTGEELFLISNVLPGLNRVLASQVYMDSDTGPPENYSLACEELWIRCRAR